MAHYLSGRGYSNPFRWPIPSLFRTYRITKKLEDEQLAKAAMAHRAAIVGANGEEGLEQFKIYINGLMRAN